MDLDDFIKFCLGFPGAAADFPFDDTTLAVRVAGRIFALSSTTAGSDWVNLKCDPELAIMLRLKYPGVKPGYHMNKKHWNTVSLESGIPVSELRRMAEHSYDCVLKKLPRRQRQDLVSRTAQ